MIPAFRQEQDPAFCLKRVFRENLLTSGTTRAMMLATDEKEEYFGAGRHREPRMVESGTDTAKEWPFEGEPNGLTPD